jgi:VWFA-related protein
MGPIPKVIGAVALAAALLGVSAGGSGVAAPSDQAAGQIREEVTVSLKLLQAYVTTKDGKPVTDLTAADFEVTDNGQKMPVTHFENHVLGGADIGPTAAVQGPRLGRKFFFFFDFAFMNARSSRRAREAALHFMDTALKPGDEVGVMSYSPMRGLTIHEYLTADHPRVRDIVDGFGLRTIVGRAESLTNMLYADELRHMQDEMQTGPTSGPVTGSTAEEFFANQAKVQTGGVIDEGRRLAYVDQARQFAQTFANLARAMRYVPGWKNVILFSAGISRALIYGERRGMNVPNMNPNNPEQMMAELNAYDSAQSNTGVRTEFAQALKELKTANSPIYAVDCTVPAGEVDIDNAVATSMTSRELTGKDSLVQLAGETGGKYFSNTMDVKAAMSTVEDVTGAFYVVGYSVPAVWDGAYHKIKIKVLRPGCKVASQNGYYNPKPFKEYSRFERLLQMTDLALSENPLNQLPYEASVTVLPVVVGGWTTLVAYAGIPKDATDRIVGRSATAYLMITDEGQKKTAIRSFAVKPREGGPKDSIAMFAVPAKPGRYSCRMVVQNLDTGAAARGSAAVSFEQPVAAPVWLDPPLLLRAEPGWEDLGAAPEATLSALFGYDPLKYAPVTGPVAAGPQRVPAALRLALGRPEAELDFTASDTLGEAATEVPVTVVQSRQDKSMRYCLIELAFGDLRPGTHTLKIAARDKVGGEGNETTTTFVVR